MIANNTDQHPCRRGTSSQHGHWTLGGQHAPEYQYGCRIAPRSSQEWVSVPVGPGGPGGVSVGCCRADCWAWSGGKNGAPSAMTGVKTVAWPDKTDVSTGARQASFQVTLQDPFQAPLRTFRFNTSQSQLAICDGNPRRKRCSARPGLFLSLCLREPPRFSALLHPRLRSSHSPSMSLPAHRERKASQQVILSTFTDEEGSWDRVYARELWNTAPRYTERSGVRIGRGSVIPDWVETAPMRNVSIRGLGRHEHYGYFVSPDDRVVVLSEGSRRVARVMR